jgi:hypothetical protein
MRTVDPNNIKTDFIAALMDIEEAHSSVSASAIPKSQVHLLAEYTFLGAAILMEGYISDLFVAYINKQNSRFILTLTNHMEIEGDEPYSKRAKQYAVVDIASHLTIDKIRKILDPKDWNVSFVSAADLKGKAGQWLDQAYASRITNLSPSHCALYDTTKAIRNFLAHRSGSAKNVMQDALINQDLPVEFRRGVNNVDKVGNFLESKPVGESQSRLRFYISEIRNIANQLCP